MSEHIYKDSDMENERYHIIPFGWRREEIIRCRDCIYSSSDAMYCTEGCYDESEYRNVEPDGFCAWGEKEE